MTTARTNPKLPHKIRSAELLSHAPLMLERGDRVQASEKIHGAVSHAIDNIAERRGWPSNDHQDKRNIARYLAERMGSDRIINLYGSASAYHDNFYQDTLETADIQAGIEQARELVRLLNEADDALDAQLRPPHGPGFRGYERKHKMEPDPPYTAAELREIQQEQRERKLKAEDLIEEAGRLLDAMRSKPQSE